MAPTTRNEALAKKIATLQLRLSPLVPLPGGPPHPDFPRTLMDYYLLTEEQLDSIAHYYHQSTPGPWSLKYPATMNWDKDFLAKRVARSSGSSAAAAAIVPEQSWLDELMAFVDDLKDAGPATELGGSGSDFARLSDSQRVGIKRRKVGKFIGLFGMDTPAEEIEGRMQASLDLAVQRSRDEQRCYEEAMLARRKVG